ncbi:hypothetical protein [Spiroplasma endosymbiont of Aspidapion aeneum]|uniref:hypothetical protein n=1 Tax=Spiroplasma endosymbiont of Aspidapion aeneum TaxID=3066276 RepID=UPI00313CAFEA
MNVGFLKRLFFYRNIDGIGDIEKELNYFNYFGINDEELIEMLSMLKENENDLGAFRKKIYEKILYQIDFYSTHYIGSNGEFILEKDEKKIPAIRAHFSAIIFFGVRLLAQEYWYIRNIVKTSFNPIITVPSFGKNKYTYTDYLESIKYFYREMQYFHMLTIDKNKESFQLYSNHDKHIYNGDFDIKSYKKIFMLIWMHTYVRISDNIYQYGLEFETEDPRKPYFCPNLLSPIDIIIVKSDEDINEDIRKRREKDWRIRESYEIKGKIANAAANAAKKIKLYDGLPYSVDDFMMVIGAMQDVLEYQSTFEVDDFVTILKNRTDTTRPDNKIPREILKSFVMKMTIKEEDILETDDLHVFVRPLIFFEQDGKEYVHSEYEIIYFTTTMIEKYKFIEKDKIKDYYNEYFPIINKIAVEETINATRRFKVKWLSMRKHYFWLENKKTYKKLFNLVDDIIYFPDTKMVVFIYWVNVLPLTKSWGLYCEDFQLVVGKNAIVNTIIKNKVTLIEMHFDLIKKMFKIKDNVSNKTTFLFDGTISIETRQIVEDHVVNLCPIKCIADFFVNDVYKK